MPLIVLSSIQDVLVSLKEASWISLTTKNDKSSKGYQVRWAKWHKKHTLQLFLWKVEKLCLRCNDSFQHSVWIVFSLHFHNCLYTNLLQIYSWVLDVEGAVFRSYTMGIENNKSQTACYEKVSTALSPMTNFFVLPVCKSRNS